MIIFNLLFKYVPQMHVYFKVNTVSHCLLNFHCTFLSIFILLFTICGLKTVNKLKYKTRNRIIFTGKKQIKKLKFKIFCKDNQMMEQILWSIDFNDQHICYMFKMYNIFCKICQNMFQMSKTMKIRQNVIIFKMLKMFDTQKKKNKSFIQHIRLFKYYNNCIIFYEIISILTHLQKVFPRDLKLSSLPDSIDNRHLYILYSDIRRTMRACKYQKYFNYVIRKWKMINVCLFICLIVLLVWVAFIHLNFITCFVCFKSFFLSKVQEK